MRLWSKLVPAYVEAESTDGRNVRKFMTAQHWVDSGQKWQYCKTCIYAVPTQAKDSKPAAFANKKMNDNLAANPTLCYPENMITQVCELTGA